MPSPLAKNIAFSCLILGCFLLIASRDQNVHSGQQSAPALLDSDHDTIPDSLDKCPDTPYLYKVDPNSRIAPLFEPEHLSEKSLSVAVDADGCAIDSDADGVPDHRDYCLNNTPLEISAGISRQGCPLQTDGDGTPDYRDRCPGTLRGIPTDGFGCPKNLNSS